jgi:hypothetical protein
MNDTMLQSTGVMQKPDRSKLLRREVASFKKPFIKESRVGEMEGFLLYVDTSGNAHRCRCSKSLWVTVDGRPTPGRSLKGLEVRKNKKFFLYFDRIEGKDVAVSFSEYPAHLHGRREGFPEGNEDVESVDFLVDAKTGSLRVDKVPNGVNTESLLRTIKAVDKASSLSPGDLLAADIEVVSVAGNRLSVTPPVVASASTGYTSDSGFGHGPSASRTL